MKKITKNFFILFSVILISITTQAQDVVVLKHTNFTSQLLPLETNLSKDYVGSGTDRGHMMPAAQNLCQTPAIQDECFYFSNMSPQYHSLNAGDWKSVETMEREWAKKDDSLHVWCGNIGIAKKIGKVSVPTQCWKVLYFVKTKEWMAFLFKNNTSKPDGIHNNLVDKKEIEKLTGFKFR